MPWSRRDDGTYLNRKVNAVGDQAYILWTYAIDYSSQQLTDGILYPREVAMLCGMRGYTNWQDLANELVSAHLFDLCDDGNYAIHDFLTYNPTKEKVLSDRARHAAEQAKWQAQKDARKARTEPITEPISEHISEGAPSRPVPSHPHDDDDARASARSRQDDELPGTMPIADQRKVLALDDVGVNRSLALELSSKCTLPRIQAVIAHARASPGLSNPTGYIVSMLRSGQAIPKPPLPGGKNVRDRANQRGPAEARAMPAAAEVMRDANGNPVSLMSIVGLAGP